MSQSNNDALEQVVMSEQETPEGANFNIETNQSEPLYSTKKLITKKDYISDVSKNNPNLTPYEIYKNWKDLTKDYPEPPKRPSKSYIFNVVSPPEPKPEGDQQYTTKTEDTILIDEPTPEDIKKAEEFSRIPIDKIQEAIFTGKITKKHVEAIFKVENSILKQVLGNDYQLEPEMIDLISEMGYTPLQRLFGKYFKEGSDLAMWLILVVYAHAPIVIKMWRDGKFKGKKKQ